MKTEFVNFDRCDDAKIKEAAEILDKGGLVAFPTETVYGIGCAVQEGAISRLNESKIEELIVTDTIPLRENAANCKKIRTLSVAKLLGEAIGRIHSADSVSSLFV